MNASPLPPEAEETLKSHAARGRELWQLGDIAGAEREFLQAWAAIPEPKADYDYAQSIARGLVNFYRDTRQFKAGEPWLDVLKYVYRDPSNPSVEFLVGTFYYEAGDLDQAFGAFDRVYRQHKKRPFQGVDKKYLEFYLERLSKRK